MVPPFSLPAIFVLLFRLMFTIAEDFLSDISKTTNKFESDSQLSLQAVNGWCGLKRNITFHLLSYGQIHKAHTLSAEITNIKERLTKMLQYGLCFALFQLSAVKAKQDDRQLYGSHGLKRDAHVQESRVSYGNFEEDKYHSLQVSVGSSTAVSDYTECALSCVDTASCSSFNVASSPGSDGKYRCELLNEDKYSANPGQLVSSQDYHHYSIKVF